MHLIYDLLFALKSANLGHEAVIEIMLSILGLMIAIFALIIAVVGWFGYASIRDEAARRAEQAAAKTAKVVAAKVARDRVARVFRETESSALTTAQAEAKSTKKPKGSQAAGQTRRKAFTDDNLRKEDQ